MKKFVLGMIIALAGFAASVANARDIALLDSANTKEFFRRRYVGCSFSTFLGEDEYRRYFLGWKYLLDGQLENFKLAGLPAQDLSLASRYDIIFDADVTEAKLAELGTKVLILSNTASLSLEQSRVIQQWVLKGGKLIATYGSGYKDIIENPHDPLGADPLKSQKGSTGGLHELWHDPWTRAFGTQALTPVPGVDILVTKNFGPTDVPGWTLLPTTLSYGAEANLLVPRPEHFRDALAFLTLTPTPAKSNNPYPAILLTRMSRGTVVYFAYAPEFIVALAFDLAGHCTGDPSYPGEATAIGLQSALTLGNNGFAAADRIAPQLLVMKRTIQFMLTGN